MFDPYFTADPNALPPVVRAVSLVLALAVIGAIVFQSAASAAVIIA